ncbi:MAG TPA: hypothetical protein VG713_00290 [Pirellulales bacterium]|nr:hypothetical protein [Pirellulales bacterium]
MTAVYEKLGMRFFYPDHWTLDESEALDGNSMLSVYSPHGAFWSVIVHPPGLEASDVADAALEAMRQEYQELDAEPFCDVIAGHEVLGSDLNFYCFDLTSTAQIRALATTRGTYLLLCQADDQEYEEVGAIFDAMTLSLLNPTMSAASFERSLKAVAAGEEADR